MTAPEEEPETNEPMISSQITVSSGFDEEGDPAVWVDHTSCSSIIEALGMLEYAKDSLLRLHAGASEA